MEIVRTIPELRTRVAEWRRRGRRIGLVPTMGGLHAGHLSLVTEAAERADEVVATLFVNPTQFSPSEDFAAYPREEAADAARFEAAGTALLFAPLAHEIYPPGHSTQVLVGELGRVLEGEFRPHFFAGVATVVTKLLLQSLPDAAMFGEKDYQQLCVVKKLVRDLDIPVEIVGVPTVREADGLAMSSRNRYLDETGRRAAPALYATITLVADAAAKGDAAAASPAADALLDAGFTKVDYVAVRDAATLAPVGSGGGAARVLAAAWIGRTRLIDNVAVPGGAAQG
jgi:pantoate--beta-alanine ligase